MKKLASEFEKSFDGLPKHRFKAVFYDGKRAIYERRKLDGTLVGFEAFYVKSSSFPVASGGRSEESEMYPRAERFGKDAWFCMSLDRAKERLGL